MPLPESIFWRRLTGSWRRHGGRDCRWRPLTPLICWKEILPDRCDETIAVTAPVEIRVKRLMARDQIPEEYARLRISAQQPQ